MDDTEKKHPSAEPGFGEDWALILVSAKSPLPKDFPVELCMHSAGKCADARITLRMEQMFEDARKDGVTLLMRSGHRSVEYQEELYLRRIQRAVREENVPEEQAADYAATIVARPGTSEHHTGLAFDLLTPEYDILDEGFENTPAFSWLCENAHRYGFVLRYPKDKTPVTGIVYEPWHWRYVGMKAAKEMRQSGECLEEYLKRTSKEVF
ncbi:MAG: M15 family metallopeptidase [Bacillota bacterium]